MTTRHKHADFIIAWANGATIQRQIAYENTWCDDIYPTWSTQCDYRIKPETIKYRVALYKQDGDSWCGFVTSHTQEKTVQSCNSFYRWLTDWIEVEV